ncbi:hypothetical protein ACIQC7_08785 [Kitasatospora sp. NPDC088556]|uniref:hypothetical protein n=1 Tax=Kitasatospora sp. NPDC088556 TaxID=3364076 RepID=UPI00382085CF
MHTFLRSLAIRVGLIQVIEIPVREVVEVPVTVPMVPRALAAKLAAADAFVETWTDSGLAWTFLGNLDTTLSCREAEAIAELFHAFGYVNTAADIISEHADLDECGDRHHTCDDDCKDGGEHGLSA